MVRLVPFVLFLACTQPKNGGGDTIDPTLDSDGDSITDVNEEQLGTDPNSVDSDGDGYQDNWEVDAGTDPTDAESGIYEGGWPYNPDKDSMVDPGDRHAHVGKTLPRLQYVDQFGQSVDFYDFAGHGKPVVIDLSGEWCGWCNVIAAWAGGDITEAKKYVREGYDFEGYFGSEDWYDLVPQLLADGDIYWITVLNSDWQGGSLEDTELGEWFEKYPSDKIAVLNETDGTFTSWVNPAGYPTVMLFDENLVLETNPDDYTEVFSTLYTQYGDTSGAN
jgi:hypothetical protein